MTHSSGPGDAEVRASRGGCSLAPAAGRLLASVSDSLESVGPESAAARVHYVTLQTLHGLCFEEEEACLGPAGGLVTSHQRREKEGA